MSTTAPTLFPDIIQTIENLDIKIIPEDRKILLKPLVDFIQGKVANKQPVRLHFICTHNSRRSHLSQIWAQTMAQYFNFQNVASYSGGTEATALYPAIVETLKKSGYEIGMISSGDNPVHYIKYAANEPAVIGFSKKMDDGFNPDSGFAAIMTCDSANEACPFVPGAEKRIPITYEDPKKFDGTPQQAEKYEERSLQIAAELFYVFSQIQN
ncbi:MAG: protein-tyrosine-phosphatase [Leeuwenhoekiella sp.]